MSSVFATSAGNSGQVSVTLTVGGTGGPTTPGPNSGFPTTAKPHGPLAYTGANVLMEFDAAAVLLVAGCLALFASRQRARVRAGFAPLSRSAPRF